MEKVKILIVEDEVIAAESMKKKLEENDYSVIGIAVSGEDAINIALEKLPDLILMDIELNGKIDGIETAEIIRKNVDIPIVYVTAFSNKECFKRAKITAPFAYILKPLRMRELQINIEIALCKNKLEKELKESNATKDKLFTIIAHDLKNAFNVILSGTQLLAEDIDDYDKETIAKHARLLNSSTGNAFKLLENLLTWSRLQRGIIECSLIRFKLISVIDSSIMLNSFSVEEKNISLINLVEDNIYIYADYDMIETVVRNLINNAVKFTDSGGKIEIKSIIKGEFAEVYISDTGVGIPENHIPDLFRIDSKFKRTGTAGETGTGLGLSLCKEFIDRNGGEFWVESEVDKGTVFTFSLPLSQE